MHVNIPSVLTLSIILDLRVDDIGALIRHEDMQHRKMLAA
jgi:hypothetical protein